ncbi:MAG: hypothetical protein NVS3B10_09980 [Polyangiales bacterium]
MGSCRRPDAAFDLMSDPHPPDGDDSETIAGPTRLPFALVGHRAAFTLEWTDDDGPHAATVSQRTLIGSAARADVVVAHPTVSRLHAELTVRDDGLWIRDLESRNGTHVDGVLVTGARLRDEGSRVELGECALVARRTAQATAVPLWPEDHFGPLLGGSAVMRELFLRLSQYAQTTSTVIVQGETGTGKELVASALHAASSRAAQPFVVVDCGALPEALLESELFGHVRGAFTGAQHDRAGAFESAEGGTVFLDEIGELPLAMQPKLLRVLESRAVRRLGEARHRPIDVRFVAATHRDLQSMVSSGAFREDLYFRLSVLPVMVPPLRARPGDLPQLVAHFLPPGKRRAIDAAQLAELASLPWLGNVRELRTFVERALAVGAQEAFALSRPSRPAPPTRALPAVPTDVPFKELREQWNDHLEREYIAELLARHGRNTELVGRAAGLDRSYVHRLMRKHDL